MERFVTVRIESEKSKLKRMSADDRREFIKWMFDNIDSIDTKVGRWNIAKSLTNKFTEETGMRINVEWINALLKYGIAKFSDDTYGFEKDIRYTVDDVCEHPTLFRNVK